MIRVDLSMRFIDGTRKYLKSFHSIEEAEKYIKETYPDFIGDSCRTYTTISPIDKRELHLYIEEEE